MRYLPTGVKGSLERGLKEDHTQIGLGVARKVASCPVVCRHEDPPEHSEHSERYRDGGAVKLPARSFWTF